MRDEEGRAQRGTETVSRNPPDRLAVIDFRFALGAGTRSGPGETCKATLAGYSHPLTTNNPWRRPR